MNDFLIRSTVRAWFHVQLCMLRIACAWLSWLHECLIVRLLDSAFACSWACLVTRLIDRALTWSRTCLIARLIDRALAWSRAWLIALLIDFVLAWMRVLIACLPACLTKVRAMVRPCKQEFQPLLSISKQTTIGVVWLVLVLYSLFVVDNVLFYVTQKL